MFSTLSKLRLGQHQLPLKPSCTGARCQLVAACQLAMSHLTKAHCAEHTLLIAKQAVFLHGRATCVHVGSRTGNILLLLLAAAPGLFFASTSLLPSSFTMYLLTLAAAFVLEGRSLRVVVSAVVGVICGWTVAGRCAILPNTLGCLSLLQWHLLIDAVKIKQDVCLSPCTAWDSPPWPCTQKRSQAKLMWLEMPGQRKDVVSHQLSA